MALTEVVPTKAWLNVTGNVVGFFVPGVATAAGIAASGSVAMEGRLRASQTGEIVAMFKDRESDQLSPIGIQDFTWYYHAEDNIDEWSAQFAEIFETSADHPVAASLPLTLKLW
jgi:hypothetical protein